MSDEQDYTDLFGPQAKKTKRGRLQTDKSANAIRIRDNQRRSRARHKEFVDELQRKVQEYEKRGIEASVQMQRAARDVSIENARLKSLLASRGVSADQVEAYLRSFDDENGRTGSPTASLPATLPPILSTPVVLEPSPAPTQLPPLQEHFSSARFDAEGEGNVAKRKYADSMLPPVLTLTPTPDVQQASPLDKLTMLANASLDHVTQQQPAPAPPPPPPPPPASAVREAKPAGYHERATQTPPRPAPPEPHRPPAASPHEMSCNAAARIIADMQGYSDERTARLALGCRTQDDECFVRNTTVFRALDHR